jgi:hypothetical protein
MHTNHKHVPVKSDDENASQTYPQVGCSTDGDLTLIVPLYNKMQHSQSFKTIFRLHDLRQNMLDSKTHTIYL